MADPIIAFDVNETLLDTSALDPLFERHFGDAGLRRPWFSQMRQLAFTGGLTGHDVDFSTAQRAAVAMLARSRGLDGVLSAGSIERSSPGPSPIGPQPEIVAPDLREIATQMLQRR
jgi:2-haloacid dehalogenase